VPASRGIIRENPGFMPDRSDSYFKIAQRPPWPA
jgi:hypothetical protein